LTFLKIVPKDTAKEICSTNDVLSRGKGGVKENERIRGKGIGICSYISKLITKYENKLSMAFDALANEQARRHLQPKQEEKKNKEGKKG
jgi:hypothetical protein